MSALIAVLEFQSPFSDVIVVCCMYLISNLTFHVKSIIVKEQLFYLGLIILF